MRVIRYKGIAIQMAGTRVAREAPAVTLAKALDRPIGRGGGLRDPLPRTASEHPLRDGYVTVAVTRKMAAWVKRQADERGLARAAFLGMVLECVGNMDADALDDFLCANQ